MDNSCEIGGIVYALWGVIYKHAGEMEREKGISLDYRLDYSIFDAYIRMFHGVCLRFQGKAEIFHEKSGKRL